MLDCPGSLMDLLIDFGKYLVSSSFTIFLTIILVILLTCIPILNKNYILKLRISIKKVSKHLKKMVSEFRSHFKSRFLQVINNEKVKKYLVRLKLIFEVNQYLNESSNLVLYRLKKRITPKRYLSYVQEVKFPSTERSFSFIPRDRIGRIVCLIFISSFLITDTTIKNLLSHWSIKIDGIGNLGALGTSSWQVLTTVVSVGLATIGIILQTISQEKNEYRKKLLLHHFFHEQQLDNKIFLSFLAVLVSGAFLLFKEKLFIYPWVSEHIYFAFVIIILIIGMYFLLIKRSFNYLFPEDQDKYFRNSLKTKLPGLIRKAAGSLTVIEHLENIIVPLGMGVIYIYDENDKKKENLKIIETINQGSIQDIDLALIKEISLQLKDKYIAERDGKPLKAQIYIEFGRPEKREYQPLAIIHKQNYSEKIDQLFKKAIILSPNDPPPLDDDLKEFHDWVWNNTKEALEENRSTTGDNFRFFYDFVDDTLRIFSEYRHRFNLNEKSAINDWSFLNKDLRKQYYVFLEYAYSLQNPSVDILFEINYFPFGLIHYAIKYKNEKVYILMSQMIIWVYRKIYNFNHPRKNDLMNNFLLVNKELAEFYILSDKENFGEGFKERKFYMDIYLKTQTDLLKVALQYGDKSTMKTIFGIVDEIKKHSSYKEEQEIHEDLVEKTDSPSEYIANLWRVQTLGIFSWSMKKSIQEKIPLDSSKYLMGLLTFNNLNDLTKAFSLSTTNSIDSIMGWDWWEAEEEQSILTRAGSWGGFENTLSKGFSILGLRLITQIEDNQIEEQTKLILENNSYFNLLISENGSILNFLNQITDNSATYLTFLEPMIQNSQVLQVNIDKLKTYLQQVKNNSEVAQQQQIITASISHAKVEAFKESFLQAYQRDSLFRKLFVTTQNLILMLDLRAKPFYGIHTLVEKEAFVDVSNVHYSGFADHYGKQIAEIEDYLIIKSLLDNKEVKPVKLFTANKLKDKVDKIINGINDSDKKDTIIFISGSIAAEESLTYSKDFEWSRENPRTHLGIYRELRVYSNRVGKESSVVILNIRQSIKVIQKRPDLPKGEMIGSDRHISFLVEELSDSDISEITSKKNAPVERIRQKVRFWSFVHLEVEIQDLGTIHKILIQSDEIKEKS